MSEDRATQLRLYCLCGQKMKISEKMYGLPGKCVACRQKIRVPRLDEVPDGVVEIFLKDHPEFLRTPAKPKRKVERPAAVAASGASAVAVAAPPAVDEDLPLGDDSERVNTVAFDVLEPHRSLCSIQHKVERKLAKLGRSDTAAREELEEQLNTIRRSRADMDEQLRQMLMETAIELANTQEKIVQEGVSARVGEVSFENYQENMDRLRRRRDRLERRQHNLRGWLVTTDPYLAGGYVDLPVTGFPASGVSVSVPSEPEDSDPLINVNTNALRKALHQRGQAERKLAEMKKLASEGEDDGMKDAHAAYRAEKRSAQAAVTFWRNRLEQLRKDYGGDMDTYSAMLDVARSRLQVGDLDRNRFDGIEKSLLRAKSDAVKAQTLAHRAINANSAQDVPFPRGTFVGRLGLGDTATEVGADSWMAWIAALVWGLAIFAPAVGDLSLVASFLEFAGADTPFRWAFLGPIGFGVAIALIAALPEKKLRGHLLAAAWLGATVVGALVIHESVFALDPMAARFRVGQPWPVRPGMIFLLAGNVLLFGAVVASWIPDDKQRRWLPALAVAGAACVTLVFTSGFGVFVPKPTVAIDQDGAVADERIVTITNEGYRSARLMAHASDARSAYLLVLERLLGAASAEDITERALGDSMNASPTGVLDTLEPGESVDLRVKLRPGNYRVRLVSRAGGTPILEGFTIAGETAGLSVPSRPLPAEPLPELAESVEEASNPVVVVPEDDAAMVDEPVETPQFSSEPPLPPPSGLEVELRAIMTGPEGRHRFTFAVYHADGTEEEMSMIPLKAELVDGWMVDEYNPELGSVVLTREDDDRIVVVRRRGERESL